MVIKGLWESAFPHVKAGKATKLKDLQDLTIGVNISSIFLHQICSRSDEYIFCYNVTPSYTPSDFIDAFKSWHNAFFRHGIKLVYVFDGVDPEVKALALSEGNEKVETARNRLNEIINKAKASPRSLSKYGLDLIKSLMKRISKPTEEMRRAIIDFLMDEREKFPGRVDLVMAPFEAKWQLVHLERLGKIQGMVTEDSDVVALGANNVYVDLNMAQSTVKHFCRSTAFDKYDKPKDLVDLSQHQDKFPLLASFLGCDYINNIPNYGAKEILQHDDEDGGKGLFLRFLDVGDDREAQQALLSGIKNCPEDELEQMEKVINVFQHCPVYCPTEQKLVPLTQFKQGRTPSNEDWGKMVGFSCAPIFALPERSRTHLDDSYHMSRDCSFRCNGYLPKQYSVGPVYERRHNPGVADDNALPLFAEIDFEKLPVKCCPSLILLSWLAARGVTFIRDYERGTIEAEVEQNLTRLIVPPSQVVQIKPWSVQEALKPLENEGWRGDWWEEIILNGSTFITSDSLAVFFPCGNENALSHAKMLFGGGNYDLDSIQFRRCVSIKDSEEMMLVRCMCLPSQKSNMATKKQADAAVEATQPNENVAYVPSQSTTNDFEEDNSETGYMVYVCLNKEGNVEGYPFSCCACLNGRGFCSHCLGLGLVLSTAQRLAMEGVTQTCFLRVMPRPPRTTPVPMLIELLAAGDLLL